MGFNANIGQSSFTFGPAVISRPQAASSVLLTQPLMTPSSGLMSGFDDVAKMTRLTLASTPVGDEVKKNVLEYFIKIFKFA